MEILSLQQRLVPELMEWLEKRYRILYHIQLSQPVGRRSLMSAVQLTERVLRAEVEVLKEQQLIRIETNGMSLTELGEQTVEQLLPLMNMVTGTEMREKKLAEKYGISKVIILPGDCDTIPNVKEELGMKAAQLLIKLVTGEDILAVTGGSTIDTVAKQLPIHLIQEKPKMVVPARGSFGGNVQTQANLICAEIAVKFQTAYRTLYIPDQLSETSLQLISQEPEVKLALDYLKQSTIVIHGIGDALTMATKRKTDESTVQLLDSNTAVGEAFGAYFNQEGKVIYKLSTVGLQIEELASKKHIIAVAGGMSKSDAIKAYLNFASPSTILITDEAVANHL